MTSRRLTRVNELIRREIGEALFRLVDEARFDVSAVTVTRVITSANLRQARVLVSIRDHRGEREAMLGRLQRHHGEFQERINRHLGLKYTPKLAFELDTSLERGDHVLDLLTRMEEEEPKGETPPAPPAETP